MSAAIILLILLGGLTASGELPFPVEDPLKLEGLYPGMPRGEAVEVLDEGEFSLRRVELGYEFHRTILESRQVEEGLIWLEGGRVERLYNIYITEGQAHSVNWLDRLNRNYGKAGTYRVEPDENGVEQETWEWEVAEEGILIIASRKPVQREGWKDPWWFAVKLFRWPYRGAESAEAVCGCGPEPVRGDCVETVPVKFAEQASQPDYPEEARKQRIEGRVVLAVVIERDGSVGQMIVQEVTDPDLGFSDAAMDAVGQWRYEPAICGGRPVSSWLHTIVEFSVSGGDEKSRRPWWKRRKK